MLILGNGKLVTRDEKNPYLENGAVAIDGTTIVKVGNCEEVKNAYPDAEFIDAKERLLCLRLSMRTSTFTVPLQEDCRQWL